MERGPHIFGVITDVAEELQRVGVEPRGFPQSAACVFVTGGDTLNRPSITEPQAA